MVLPKACTELFKCSAYGNKVIGENMGRKVRIEFEEVAGYPQQGTLHLWLDGEEIYEPLSRDALLKRFLEHLLLGR